MNTHYVVLLQKKGQFNILLRYGQYASICVAICFTNSRNIHKLILQSKDQIDKYISLINVSNSFQEIAVIEHLGIYFQCLCSSSNPTQVRGTCLLKILQIIFNLFGTSERSLISGDQGWNKQWRLSWTFTKRNNSSIFDLNTNYFPTHSLFWSQLHFGA